MTHTPVDKNGVITLLILFNRMIFKILRLKVKDKQALGLLADAMRINKQILSLIKGNKISLEFVRQTYIVLVAFVRDVVSKWLLRYYLTPLLAFNIYALRWTINQSRSNS